MKQFAYVVFLLLLLLSACQKGVRVTGELAMLDSLVDVDYDSALSVLVQLDTRGMEKGEQMYALLLKGKAMNKADSLFTTDSVMKEVCDYFDRHGNSNQRMLAHYVLGCAYRDMGDAPRALQCYQDAVEQADTTKSDCDFSTLMRVHSQMSKLYRKQRLTDYDLTESRIAEQMSWKMGDTLSALLLKQNVCNALFVAGNYDACIDSTLSLYQQYLHSRFKREGGKVLAFLIKSNLKKHDYTEAKKYIDLYSSTYQDIKDYRHVIGGYGPINIYKGDYYLGMEQLDSAEHFYRIALHYKHLSTNSILTNRGLYEVFKAKAIPDSTLKYAEEYGKEKEKKYDNTFAKTNAQIVSLYNYAKSEERFRRDEQQKNILLSITLILFAILSFFTLLLLFLRKQQLEKENKIALLNLQIEENLNIIGKYQREIEDITEVYKRVDNEHTEQREMLKRTIQENMNKISELMRINDSLRNESNLKTFVNSPIVKHLETKTKSNQPTQSDWDSLSQTVQRYFPEYYNLLSASGLNENHFRFCLLAKAEFSSSKIEQLLNTESGYASKTKMRLARKLFNEQENARIFDINVHTMR